MQATKSKVVRLAYLVSHPIQYQAPLLRRIAQEPDIDLTVFFGSDFSVRGYQDEGFGVDVKWDVPLLDGYKHEFLPALIDRKTSTVMSPLSRGIFNRLKGHKGQPGFDVLWVHGYATANSLSGMLAAKALGIPVLLRAESWLRDRKRSGLKLFAKDAFFAMLRHLVDGVMPIGTLNREYWQRYLGEDMPRSMMPYSVDNEYFQERSIAARPGRSVMQAELGLDPGRPVILFASKLTGRKQCTDLIAAYAKLSPAPGVAPHPYLVIVGDGELRASLEAQAKETGFSSEIRFCGFKNQSELPKFFELATVFALPSRHEPWGLIVNEVMNAGKPVIVTDDVGCQPDLITDGVEGCVFPTGDISALADALRRVLSSEGTAETMGKNALARIARWSFEEDVQGLRSAIQKATGKFVA
jgi:glycosyltransferase involved in cell wall biosynthesis